MKEIVAGVGVLVYRKNPKTDQLEILMMRREGKIGGGTWNFPGGKIDPGESAVIGGIRELEEEAGITVKNAAAASMLLVKFPHSQIAPEIQDQGPFRALSFTVVAEYDEGEARILETNKASAIRWFPIDELPAKDEMFHTQAALLHDMGVSPQELIGKARARHFQNPGDMIMNKEGRDVYEHLLALREAREEESILVAAASAEKPHLVMAVANWVQEHLGGARVLAAA